MTATISETNKKPGVCYTVTDDRIELPVIDLTHPAFAFEMSNAELSTLVNQFVLSLQRQAQAQHGAMQVFAKQSILVRGFVGSAGTYTTGMMTYLSKLGPDNRMHCTQETRHSPVCSSSGRYARCTSAVHPVSTPKR